MQPTAAVKPPFTGQAPATPPSQTQHHPRWLALYFSTTFFSGSAGTMTPEQAGQGAGVESASMASLLGHQPHQVASDMQPQHQLAAPWPAARCPAAAQTHTHTRTIIAPPDRCTRWRTSSTASIAEHSSSTTLQPMLSPRYSWRRRRCSQTKSRKRRITSACGRNPGALLRVMTLYVTCAWAGCQGEVGSWEGEGRPCGGRLLGMRGQHKRKQQ